MKLDLQRLTATGAIALGYAAQIMAQSAKKPMNIVYIMSDDHSYQTISAYDHRFIDRPSLGSKEFGMDHFNLDNPEVYTFMDRLFAEYLSGKDPVFRGKIGFTRTNITSVLTVNGYAVDL